jgi:drug/metabolite transporter (DMT)-like permease
MSATVQQVVIYRRRDRFGWPPARSRFISTATSVAFTGRRGEDLLFIILLRRLSIRSRAIVGLILACAGVALIVVSVVAVSGLLIHGVIVAVLGVIFLASAMASRRRARLGVQPDAGQNSESDHVTRMRAGER